MHDAVDMTDARSTRPEAVAATGAEPDGVGADAIFAEPRLAEVYDPLDPDRSDLDAYERLVVDEVGATTALDVGCGTGELAIRLAARGVHVVGVDPARASVDVARGKPGADAVTWVVGIGVLVGFAVWIAAHTTRTDRKKKGEVTT